MLDAVMEVEAWNSGGPSTGGGEKDRLRGPDSSVAGPNDAGTRCLVLRAELIVTTGGDSPGVRDETGEEFLEKKVWKIA